MEPLTATIVNAIAGATFKWLAGKALSGVQSFLFPTALSRRIGSVAHEWSQSLPDGARLHDFRAILATEYPHSPDNQPPEPVEVSAKLNASQIPTADDWFTVLIRQWLWVKSVVEDPTEFFTIEQQRAEVLLRDLAERLAKECQKEPSLATGQALAYHAAHEDKLDRLLLMVEQSVPRADPSGFHPRIDAAVEFTRSAQPDVAIAQLDALRRTNWDHMTPRERYRTIANLGHAYDAKGEDEKAAKYFIECQQYQPDDEMARALEAVGTYMLGDRQRALDLANAILDDFPGCDLAHAMRVRCELASRPFVEIEDSVPPSLRPSPETHIALSSRALQAGVFDKAEHYARLAQSQGEYSAAVAEHLAVVVLSRVRSDTEEQLVLPPRLGDLKPLVVEALELLTQAFDRTPAIAGKARGRIRFYQGIATYLLGDVFSSDSHFRAAVESDPTQPDFIRHLAIGQFEAGHRDEAFRILRSGVPYDASGQITLMLAACLFDRNASNDANEAIFLLDVRLTKGPSIEGSAREQYIDLLLQCYGRDARHEDADALLERERASLSDGLYDLFRAKALRRTERKDEAAVAIRKALAFHKDATDFRVKRLLAEELTTQGLWRDALRLWKELVQPHDLGPYTDALLKCAWNEKDDGYLLDFCAALRSNGQVAGEMFHLEVNKLTEYNALGTALSAIQEYLAQPTDEALAKELRVRLSHLAPLVGRDDLLCYDLYLLPRPSDTLPDIGLMVVMNLVHGPRPLDAVEYAYELVREHFKSSSAHKAMILSVLWRPRELALPEPKYVVPGSAVKFEDELSGVARWHIIEDSTDPDNSRFEFSPSNSLSKAMLGKRIDDVFLVRKDHIQERRAKVLEIWSKYKFRFNRCLEEWETSFPDDRWLWSVSFKRDQSGKPDVNTALEPLDKQAAFVAECEAVYAGNMLSATAFARMVGVTVLQAVQHLLATGSLPIRCVLGRSEECFKAQAAIDDVKPLILDGSALATLYVTGMVTEIGSLGRKCIVSVGTLLELRQMLLEVRSAGTRRLTKHKDKYVVAEESEASVEERALHLERFINAVEAACRIEEGTALARLTPSVRDQLLQRLDRPAAETIALARERRYVVWSDDIWVAAHAGECQVPRVWTEWLLRESMWQIAVKKRHLYIAMLVACRYLFLRLTPEALLQTLAAAEWNRDDPKVKALLAWFAIHELTDRVVEQAASESLLRVCQQAPTRLRAELTMDAILTQLAQRPGAKRIIGALMQQMGKIVGDDVFAAREVKKVLSMWQKSI